jgi:large subunit ribosomal protein L14
MIIRNTVLKVADNSGVRLVRCLNIGSRRFAVEGDLIVVSVRRVKNRFKLVPGKVCKAVVVQCKFSRVNIFGGRFGFRSNRVVLLRRLDMKFREAVPYGTRVSKVVSIRLREKGFVKLSLLAPSVF